MLKEKLKRATRSVKNWIGAALVAVLGFFGYHEAQSQSAATQDVLTWTHPPQNTDGSALALSSIAKTIVVWGTTPGGPYPNTQDVAAPAATVTILRGANNVGTRCYKVATVVVTGEQSAFSNEGCKTVKAPPNPPTNLQVN